MVVLLAEDDELILKTIEHKLKKEGFEVILTRNGQEAIELIRTQHMDLIISDIMMPFASGIEILAEVKQLERPIPIMMLSSMGQEDIVIEAFQLGASDYMIKPFSPNELILRINKLLNRP
ncbi:response regulator [Sphingobacterium sp.]|uniref:response regulator transcription factor n=1 Tax=Sphingobacterium sp. TaxID=341027 RepID=UPI0028A084DE|nr:response regulator [Sphingobacterium sp.]